jgi:hypothetical protein
LRDTFGIPPRLVKDYANALWFAFEQPSRFIELRQDEQALADASYHLALATATMREMSEDFCRKFEDGAPLQRRDGELIRQTLQDSIHSVEAVRDVLLSIQGNQRGSKFSGRKQNWALISLTRMARRVWAAGNRVADPEKLGRAYKNSAHILLWRLDPSSGPALEYETFLENFAPISQKPDAPGPFGRFFEEILVALAIQNRNGGRMTASSALRAWREV